jgi:hypothetical protein
MRSIKATAQFVLQRLDAAAQRRLRQVQAAGGAAERAAVGQCQQVFQLFAGSRRVDHEH